MTSTRWLVARAPTRLDFGGGWTDVPPYPERDGGFVCNVAIARYATVRLSADAGEAAAPTGAGYALADHALADHALADAALRRAKLPNVSLDLTSDFPVGAGLGGSSAVGVAMVGALAAWRGDAPSREALAEASRAIEVEDLCMAGGRQDHYAAALGGALALRFGTAVAVERLPLRRELAYAIARRCIVVYTGQSRISGRTITGVISAYEAGERRVTTALARMKALAEQMADALRRDALDDLGGLVGEHWVHQRALHAEITTPTIDAIIQRAERAGALGAKALGASGGGCVLVVAPDDGVERVRAAVEPLGQLVPFTVDEEGFRVVEE